MHVCEQPCVSVCVRAVLIHTLSPVRGLRSWCCPPRLSWGPPRTSLTRGSATWPAGLFSRPWNCSTACSVCRSASGQSSVQGHITGQKRTAKFLGIFLQKRLQLTQTGFSHWFPCVSDPRCGRGDPLRPGSTGGRSARALYR